MPSAIWFSWCNVDIDELKNVWVFLQLSPGVVVLLDWAGTGVREIEIPDEGKFL